MENENARTDRVEMQGGIVHLPAEFVREVARLANRAGLEGFEVADVECGLHLDAIKALSERPAPEIEARLDDLPWPKSRILITYKRRDSDLYRLIDGLTINGLRKRAANMVEHAGSIGVRVQGSEGRWTNEFLADLPGAIAIREAFRLLLDHEGPIHRRVKPEGSDGRV